MNARNQRYDTLISRAPGKARLVLLRSRYSARLAWSVPGLSGEPCSWPPKVPCDGLLARDRKTACAQALYSTWRKQELLLLGVMNMTGRFLYFPLPKAQKTINRNCMGRLKKGQMWQGHAILWLAAKNVSRLNFASNGSQISPSRRKQKSKQNNKKQQTPTEQAAVPIHFLFFFQIRDGRHLHYDGKCPGCS